jgi:hypothetical protein
MIKETKMENINERINIVMNKFDFDGALKIMKAVGWRYQGEEVTLEMIKDTARFVMERAKNYPNMGSVSTGGFEAEYRDGYMYLRFVPFEYVG